LNHTAQQQLSLGRPTQDFPFFILTGKGGSLSTPLLYFLFPLPPPQNQLSEGLLLEGTDGFLPRAFELLPGIAASPPLKIDARAPDQVEVSF